MQFKHPEILWALLLLIIPILIHLFQLRRFQKVAFTNVKFLQNVVQQTRKSSQIKKWLTLFTRLFLFTSLIIAFAQPYTSKKSNFKTPSETVIYIDNSHSMEAKGNNGTLLNGAIQTLLTDFSSEENLTVFTNDKAFKNTSIKAISNDLISLGFSSNQLSYEDVYLKGKSYFSKDKASLKSLVMVSDFQEKTESFTFETDSEIDLKLVPTVPVSISNIYIDSAYIDSSNPENFELSVKLGRTQSTTITTSVSLSSETDLLAKTAVDFSSSDEVTFTLPNLRAFEGVISIEDDGLKYDNTLYFNFNSDEKIKVLSINGASDDFLKRIYTEDEFTYLSYDENNLNYNVLTDQNLIILNELKVVPSSLITVLQNFKSNGGSVLIIPSVESELASYNQLFTKLNSSLFTVNNSIEKRITTISFSHPILRNTFYDKVTNFQYPKVITNYSFSSTSNSIFSFDDGEAFLIGKTKIFTFSSAINDTNSNFKNSPLIVPVLYNIGKQSLELPQLYYSIGDINNIDIKAELGPDDILSLVSKVSSVIPLQRAYSSKVSLTLNEFPENSGIIEVNNNDQTLQKLSFNYKRTESDLNYHKLRTDGNYSIDSTLSSAIADIKSNTNINELWKWFVIFAVIFLIIEMLILKYLK